MTERGEPVIEVDPRTRSSLYGLFAVILAAGWAAYGLLNLGQVGLTVMVVLSILLIGVATFLVRPRKSG
jgi:hypothetical protein